MERPKLTPEESAIVEHLRAELSGRLLRQRVPAERWAHVTLGVVIDLAGEVLKLHERDTERPGELCNIHHLPPHCTLANGHVPPCSFEAWPP